MSESRIKNAEWKLFSEVMPPNDDTKIIILSDTNHYLLRGCYMHEPERSSYAVANGDRWVMFDQGLWDELEDLDEPGC